MSFRTEHEKELRAAHKIVRQEDEKLWVEQETGPNTLFYVERIRDRIEEAIQSKDWAKVFQAHDMLTNEISAIKIAMYAETDGPSRAPLFPEYC